MRERIAQLSMPIPAIHDTDESFDYNRTQSARPTIRIVGENGTDLGVLKLTEEELNDDGSVYYLRASFSLKAKVHLGTEYKLEITNSAGVKKVITIKT
ncbi:MAG: hypothetical protein COX62_05670 [Deltaproteobacteria bacterium CG_4_10_14_0_2_um_filter_43_8]|nr:MAG: hypothetical protein COV43_08275 [Deltaproteobacteria bacterium CG11_big_fil_rev_8_21_14_0_20_42_23]PJA19929.1 MAG: hypothetical protein COX62_05670 [Deltaproteobacteria bacterium CG_4_10_14_0_2_um_filter_43_8]PJC63724.1 MAG: hypothetical protein CO021_08030 [Deltaproteobacteria bacterium CG_4_9_14_0_2_um_filter_42_21]